MKTAADIEFESLFPAGDYHHSVGVRPRPAEAFFAPTGNHAELIGQRRRWLADDRDEHAAVLDEGIDLLDETLALARTWGVEVETQAAGSPIERCVALSSCWEPDFLLLKPDPAGVIRLWGGSVCFPSNWSFQEKLGKSLDWIHGVVPGLNDELGAPVDRLLRRLKTGKSWERANWGMSRSAELNLHPKRGLPRLDASVRLDEVWFRVERQALVALPNSGGVLFGIRLEICPLAELRGHAGLIRALETMPEPMAVYKSIADARQQLLRLLAE